MPIDSTTAKPLIGPEPNRNMMMATMMLRLLASQIVRLASLKPVSTLAMTPLPLRCSSRIRSLISTLASTAAPMVNTIPAMPGSVRVKPAADMMPRIIKTLMASAITEYTPKRP